MYKFIGLAMMGVFVMMIIPGNFDAVQGENNLIYGMATIIKNDNLGDEVFQQSIHNQLTDEGEVYILQAIFDDGTSASGDTESIGTICVSDQTAASAPANELLNSTAFDSANGFTDSNCKQETAAAVGISGSIATIGSLTFVAGGTNIANDETISSIGICQNEAGDNNDYANCATGGPGVGILLAVVNVTPTTLASGETVDITYTFSLVSTTT